MFILKLKEIMNTSFEVCPPEDTFDIVAEKISLNNRSFVIATDSNGKYKGIIKASTVLQNLLANKKVSLDKLIIPIKAVLENEDIYHLKNAKINLSIVPVIDRNNNAVGYINLKSIISNIDSENLEKIPYMQNSKTSLKYITKYTIDNYIGESKPILLLKKRILAAAKTTATVLIMGETGTGKELVAHAITSLSSRRHQPFIRINCAAIPENLLESELFGYEEGAFTGALKGGSKGKFLQANRGTIFLDEIGDMPLFLQAKILRVLQEREIERIGASYPIPIDVRIVAATHANLIELVKENKFRKDLFYRLNVIPINVPPLRHHKEDIHLLVDYFINKISDEMGIEKPIVDISFIKSLMAYEWSGNIRELLNVLQMAVSFSDGILTDKVMKEYLSMNGVDFEDSNADNDLKSLTDEVEKNKIIKAMESLGGNKIKVAKSLGISRSNLYYKMKKYNI